MATKQRKQIILIACDLLLIPSAILFRWLSKIMLGTSSVCKWTLIGGKCLTCGGTHFVNDLLSGRIVDAFHDNEYLFLLTIYLAITMLLLNLYYLFRLTFAKKILSVMYNLTMLIVFLASIFAYLFIRNIPLWTRLIEVISSGMQ